MHCYTNTRLSVSILVRVCLHQNTAATLCTVPHGSGNRPRTGRGVWRPESRGIWGWGGNGGWPGGSQRQLPLQSLHRIYLGCGTYILLGIQSDRIECRCSPVFLRHGAALRLSWLLGQPAECGDGYREIQGPCLSAFVQGEARVEGHVPVSEAFHPGRAVFALDPTCVGLRCFALPLRPRNSWTHMFMALWRIDDNEPATELELRPVQEG